MAALRFIAILLTISLATVAAAAEFDGSVPLQCAVDKGHDCLPGANECTRLKPETDIAPIFGIDVAKKEIRSPFRTALLPILYTTTNRESLVLQGADLQFAWSALINKTSGALTVTIADRKGAYVAFGQCKAAATN
jgi:hypothetical protein